MDNQGPSVNHPELSANTGSERKETPAKSSRNSRSLDNKTVGTGKRKQRRQGKESPSQKKGGSKTGPQPSNPSLNKRQRKKPKRETTEGEGATRGQGDRTPQQRPHGSSTHRSSRRGQKTATKQPVTQKQVKDKPTQQKEDQPRRAAETAQTLQLTCASRDRRPEAHPPWSTHQGWEPQERMTEQQIKPKGSGSRKAPPHCHAKSSHNGNGRTPSKGAEPSDHLQASWHRRGTENAREGRLPNLRHLRSSRAGRRRQKRSRNP